MDVSEVNVVKRIKKGLSAMLGPVKNCVVKTDKDEAI